jgi:hypothetical protein
MAKVEPDRRFRFFSRDVEKPLLWFDRHGGALAGELET